MRHFDRALRRPRCRDSPSEDPRDSLLVDLNHYQALSSAVRHAWSRRAARGNCPHCGPANSTSDHNPVRPYRASQTRQYMQLRCDGNVTPNTATAMDPSAGLSSVLTASSRSDFSYPLCHCEPYKPSTPTQRAKYSKDPVKFKFRRPHCCQNPRDDCQNARCESQAEH
jgi:hypothetical protein